LASTGLHARRINKPGQLYYTLVRSDVDLSSLGGQIVDKRDLHLGRKHAVVDELSGGLLRASREACAGQRPLGRSSDAPRLALTRTLPETIPSHLYGVAH
jgi:hypothetical protein